MSFFSSIFGGAQQPAQQPAEQATQQQTPPQPQQQPQISDANNPQNLQGGNNTTAQISQGDPSQQQAKSPIEQLTEIMQNSQKPAQQQPDNFFNLDPARVQEIVSTMDFTAGIPQETMQAFQQGDVKAMMSIMQAMQRNAVASSLQMSNKLVEHGTKHASSQLQQTLPSQIMKQNVTESLLADNQYAAPFAAMIVDGLAKTNPNLNQSQLQAQAEGILNKFADSVAQHIQSKQPAPQSQSNQQVNQQQDFMQLLGLNDNSRPLF